jgi:hypothetical protein
MRYPAMRLDECNDSREERETETERERERGERETERGEREGPQRDRIQCSSETLLILLQQIAQFYY